MTNTVTPRPEEAQRRAGHTGPAAWPYVVGFLGWLLPGLGHLVQRKYDRAGIFFVSVAAMAGLGVAMGAKLYVLPFGEGQGMFVGLLHVLAFLGDLGAGLLFFLGWMAGFGRDYLARASGDYGTVFFLCAGLLNLLTVLDAYDIAVGKKD